MRPETSMEIGLWNIDHPETGSGSRRKEQRYSDVLAFLKQTDCDILILTEANAAMKLPGYTCYLSEKSPFRSKRRFYGPPNQYHQVAVYSRIPVKNIPLAEPINGVRCQLPDGYSLKEIYGNVVTLKDRWKKDSSKTQRDRLQEQVKVIQTLPQKGVLIGGDFNLKPGWNKDLHARVKQELGDKGWAWPTENRNDGVQQILHSPDLNIYVDVDQSPNRKYHPDTGLSDHPFIRIRTLYA